MLDIKIIREQPDVVRAALRDKRIELDLDELLRVDAEGRQLQFELEGLQRQRNENTRAIQAAAADARAPLVQRGRDLNASIKQLEPRIAQAAGRLRELMLLVPQIPAADAPRGATADDNVEVRRWGDPSERAGSRDHVELLRMHGWAEFDRIGRIAGSRSYALRGVGALLEMSLLRFGADKLVAKGFTLMAVPSFAGEDAFVGTGHFPTGRDQAYYVPDADRFLAGTSEVTLNSLHAGEILPASALPILYAGISTCFRSEAGNAGRDVRGLVRVHQFQKVEQFILCKNDPAESARWHDRLLATSEEILQELEIPYRVVACCTGDMGAGKVRMNDIESWVPSEKLYRETHSCSTLHDWQARRTNLRYRDEDDVVRFCHTLNNTAVATPRLLVPLLENHQDADGKIRVPRALQPYLAGRATVP